MPWLTLLLLLLLLLPACRRIRALRSAHPEAALKLYRRTALLLGGGVIAAMAGQELLLLRAGQLTWATALPLHLCSLMGLTCPVALLTRRPALMHALFYAGLPGALLALSFPAVAQTPWPRLTALLFHMMHAGILCAPLLPLALGWRPRTGGAIQAGLFLLGAGAVACIANACTGGNYLFLAGPVAGTPLMWLARWGRGMYQLLLLLLAFLLLCAEAAAVRCISRPHHAAGGSVT